MRASSAKNRSMQNKQVKSLTRSEKANSNPVNRNSSHTSTQADFEVFETEYGIDIGPYGKEIQKSIQLYNLIHMLSNMQKE